MDEIQRSLGRLEGKFESFDKKFDAFCASYLNDQRRITVVERKVNWFSGIFATVLFAINYFKYIR